MRNDELNAPAGIRSHLAAERASYEGGCKGRGYYAHFDTDYDCRGCRGCSTWKRLGGNLADAGKLAAGADLRATLEPALAAAEALAAIGRAVKVALTPGLALESLMMFGAYAWGEVVKGRWYRVDGKRGNARKWHGMLGLVKWIGTEERRSAYGTWSYGSTTRAGLQIAGQNDGKLCYVSVGNLTPVPEPTTEKAARVERETTKEDRAARESVRPTFVGGKGAGLIVAGEHVGKRGSVFWRGTGKGGEPLGVKFCACKRRCQCEVAWCSPRDVVNAAPVRLDDIETKNVDGDEIVVDADAQLEMIVTALVTAGFDVEAQAWLAKREWIVAESLRERVYKAEQAESAARHERYITTVMP